MPFQFQSQEQRRNAEQSVQADAPQNQPGNLRGQQNTALLGLAGSEMPTDPASKKIQQGIFDKAFANYRANRGTTATGTEPLVEPAERARDSEVQRMAQQYGGFDMGMAIREKAQGKTPEDLVKFYQAQRAAGQDETMKQEMVQYFAQQDAFANHSLAAKKQHRCLLIKTLTSLSGNSTRMSLSR